MWSTHSCVPGRHSCRPAATRVSPLRAEAHSTVWLLLIAVVLPLHAAKLTITPENPLLFGKSARQALVVTVQSAGGVERDVTAEAKFRTDRATVATVDAQGVIHAEGNGAALIRVRYHGLEASTTALIQRAGDPPPASFAGDILPVLTRIGCNGGSCHGALKGQNGFKLSLFGYDADADYDMIVHKHDGRRINLPDSEQSLILLKPTFQVNHGGGKVLRKGSPEYETLLAWLRGGAKREAAERRMTALEVLPRQAVLYGAKSQRRMLVRARYSDGAEADVTRLVKFSTNDDSIAAIAADGLVTALRPGETAIVVRGPGLAAASKIGVVTDNRPVPPLSVANFIDDYVGRKLAALHIPPSEPCDDATFLRRAYLDIIGLVPAAEEARRFLADHSPDKRSRLVEELLSHPEYADYWALYWGDHLNNTRQLLYNKGPYSFTRWLYDQFRRNTPYDQFVRKLLASSGNMFDVPATSFYPLMKKEPDLAAMTSQLFLGVSIECARCHNHPLEKWTQNDFNGMAAFFSQVRYKNAGPRNNERVLYVDFTRQFQNPETKQAYLPKPLGAPAMTSDEWTDRREMLANWLTSPGNPYFTRAIVNRMWRNFLGRGLVEPVDDFRATNPPTNEALLDALAKDFVDHGYDLHHLIRRITSSNAYQLSSTPNARNREDTTAYSHYYPRRLAAEPLLDSICQATGVPERYRSQYPGTRAAQLPEPEIESYFLEVFDRPSRQLVCERKNGNTLNQSLHMIAGSTVQRKVTAPDGWLTRAIAGKRAADEIVTDLYLSTLSRFPSDEERQVAREAVRRAGDVKRGLQDVFWALLNSKEFLYNH